MSLLKSPDIILRIFNMGAIITAAYLGLGAIFNKEYMNAMIDITEPDENITFACKTAFEAYGGESCPAAPTESAAMEYAFMGFVSYSIFIVAFDWLIFVDYLCNKSKSYPFTSALVTQVLAAVASLIAGILIIVSTIRIDRFMFPRALMKQVYNGNNQTLIQIMDLEQSNKRQIFQYDNKFLSGCLCFASFGLNLLIIGWIWVHYQKKCKQEAQAIKAEAERIALEENFQNRYYEHAAEHFH